MARPRTFMNEDVLDVIESHPDQFVTAGEVADEIGVTNGAVTDRLRELEDSGDLEKKKVGANAIVWWLTEKATTPRC